LVKQPGIIAGIDVARKVFQHVDAELIFSQVLKDGDSIQPGDVAFYLEGSSRSITVGERLALNFMQRMSGIATKTHRIQSLITDTKCKLLDTRKTTPGLRALEKYAVRCGGGQNHRMSLSDAALVKDNHIVAAGGVAEAFAKVRALADSLPIEIEVDTLEQLQVALDAGANVVLLDNMPPAVMKEAVVISQRHTASTGHSVLLEASGGLTLGTARAVAETGVHFISVGGLTHSSPILDVGLDLQTIV
jgi:nicotinate-nucleotide pyrophosphorylase (carboxylating)